MHNILKYNHWFVEITKPNATIYTYTIFTETLILEKH